MAARRFRHQAHVALGDAAPDGRARFDAIARWLQDVAFLDVADAGFAEEGAWVVRRTRVDVERFPAFGEQLQLETWCSGLGKMWAERSTTVRGDRGGYVAATALWVFVDPASGRPRPLDPAQLELWEPSADGHRVRARLQHPAPPEDAPGTPWRFRAADLDIADHVNNAAYWSVLEEHLVGAPPVAPVAAEVEYRGAAPAGPAQVRRDGGRWWVCSASGEVHASFALIVS